MRPTNSSSQIQGSHERAFVIEGGEISDATLEVLDRELQAYGDPNKVFAQAGSAGLDKMLRETDPTLMLKLEAGRRKLDRLGIFVMKKTGLDQSEESLAQLGAITLSCIFGTPTQTTPNSPVIAWPITYKPESTNTRKTFSETNSEASFHTDSQYIENPEQYFGLFCIRPDEYSGGVSQVVDGVAVIDQLKGAHGDSLVNELARPYPFRLPSVFTKNPQDQEVEMVWAPVFSEGKIRYRHDTLMSALEVDGVNISDAQHAAIDAFEEVLKETRVDEYSLEAGDVMFVNNHRMLHGRTAFDDDKRLLYRVRMG